jgi:import receptor subunit TOM70
MNADPSLPNTYIKMASILVEHSVTESLPEALKLFERGLAITPNDPDLYYHRGQIHFLVQDYQRALADYNKSIDLDPNFMFAQIQRAVTEYRLGSFNKAIKLFENARKQFPHAADIHFYQGEVLLDHQDIDGALACFERATKTTPSLPLPYLNQAIIQSHVKGNVAAGIELTQKAIEVDSRCDLAYMHLAQMFMAQGRIDEAIAMYEKSLTLARTSLDVENAVMGIEASHAQKAAMQYVTKLKQQA